MLDNHQRSALAMATSQGIVGIVGDAHAARMRASLAELEVQRNVKVEFRARGGCLIANRQCGGNSPFYVAIVLLGGNDLVVIVPSH